MHRLFSGLGRFVVRYRFLVVLFWLVALVLTARTLPSVGSEVNNDNSQFLPSSAPSSRAATLATPLLGNPSDNSQVFVIAARPAGLGLADEAALKRLAALDSALPGVRSVQLVALSAKGQAVEARLQVSINQSDVTRQTTLVAGIEHTFVEAHAPPGLQLHLAGAVATNVANQKSSNRAGGRTQGLSFLLIIVILLLILRSVLAPIVTLLPAGIALAVSERLIGGLGASGLKISIITELLLIVLLLGAGTDYGLFLVFRVREEMRNGLDTKSAVESALVRVGESITASAGTVVFALLTLLLATFGIYKDLGAPLALGVVVMLVAGLTLLPALLAICGKALFWPSRIGPATAERDGLWGRAAVRLVRRPGATLSVGILVFVGLAAFALSYHSGGFGGALNAPAGSDAAAGNAEQARYFPQSSSNPANLVFTYDRSLWQDPQAIATAERVLTSSGEFTRLVGPLDPAGTTLSPSQLASLHRRLGDPRALTSSTPPPGVSLIVYNAYRSTQQFVSGDGHTIQFEAALRAGGQQTNAAMAATPVIRSVVARAGAASGARADGVAGEAAALYDVSSTSNHDLLTIVPIAILAIALLLALVLRSLVAPLYLIVSVALSYLAALGVATLVFIDIGGQSGLSFILPFLMFIFLLALGEDYNILVMTRIREEAHRLPLRQAVIRAVGRTGPTVTSAGVILAGTFAVFAIAGSSGPSGGQIRDIGFGVAIGILMDTFLVRTLLVPSTVALLGRINWWPMRVEVDEDAGPVAGPGGADLFPAGGDEPLGAGAHRS